MGIRGYAGYGLTEVCVKERLDCNQKLETLKIIFRPIRKLEEGETKVYKFKQTIVYVPHSHYPATPHIYLET